MSYQILFSIAASQNMEIEQIEVKTAFLNSPIRDDVFVEQPHGFEVTSLDEEKHLRQQLNSFKTDQLHPHQTFPRIKRSSVQMVCKLQKALYGLKQAPRAWYETFSTFLRTLHLHPLSSDYAVFLNQAKA